ncbi:hypothetical protein EDEG_03138 [Edhazardia aedis USNM 41457]|uniref:Uncharacterized protein n=1 Tax=Edhazardia aedis (strain USNM 41457) TaxID=1003232 RepID=J9DM39_EDHAE|nr:hypothetical protein EDEG_03138 [Edhazardia aedis USNM 41457]|eukprot:EJW02447.1 hypothetical protein EDEG_03138 [Edhazardia aedis USNM 41457]
MLKKKKWQVFKKIVLGMLVAISIFVYYIANNNSSGNFGKTANKNDGSYILSSSDTKTVTSLQQSSDSSMLTQSVADVHSIHAGNRNYNTITTMNRPMLNPNLTFTHPRPINSNQRNPNLQSQYKQESETISSSFEDDPNNTLKEEFYHMPVKVPVENEFFSIRLPNKIKERQRNLYDIDLKNIRNTFYQMKWSPKDRPFTEKAIDKDSDSTAAENLPNQDEINDENTIKLEDFDVENFIKEWVEIYNSKVELESKKIKYLGDNTQFDNLINKIVADKLTVSYFLENRKVKMFKKNDFDKILKKIIEKNSDIISKIYRKLKNDNIKDLCLKLYLHGLDFDLKDNFRIKGMDYIFKQKHMLLSAIGMKIKDDIIRDSKNALDEFSRIYTDEFIISNSLLVLKVKKGILKNLLKHFKNPCLIKVLRNALFKKENTRNLSIHENFEFDKALIENENHELKVIFNNIVLTSDDIKNLLSTDISLTISEIIFSQGFSVRSKLFEHDNFKNILENVKEKLSKICILPKIFFDQTDHVFIETPIKISNFPQYDIIDEISIRRIYTEKEKINPFTSENIYKISDYQPADKLKRSWSRFKARLSPELDDFFKYVERERYYISSFALHVFGNSEDCDLYEIAWDYSYHPVQRMGYM